MSILDDFVAFCLDPDLGCYLLKIPLFGNLNSYDAYDRTVSITNTPYIKASGHGFGLFNDKTGRVEIANGAEQQGTSGTIFIGCDQLNRAHDSADVVRLINKRDSGCQWDFYYNDSGQFDLYDGASHYITASDIYTDYRSAAAVFEDGVPWDLYLDGAYVNSAGDNSSISGTSDVINIGINSASNTESQECGIQAIALFSEKLTSTQLGYLHTLFARLHARTAAPHLDGKREYIISPAPIIRFDGSRLNGQVQDLSGNALHFDHAQTTRFLGEGPSGGTVLAGGGGNGSPTNLYKTDASLVINGAFTFSFWVKRHSDGETNFSRLCGFNNGLLNIYFSSNGRLYVQDYWSVTNGNWYSYELIYDEWRHFVIRSNRAEGEAPIVWVDGKAVSVTTSTASAGTVSLSNGVSVILDYTTYNRECDADVDDFQVFKRYITDDEATELYLRSALRKIDRGYGVTIPNTLVNKTSGNIGCFNIISGSFNSVDNKITCVSSGIASCHNKYATGAWYFKFTSDLSGSSYFLPIASYSGTYNDSMQNGYMLEFPSNGRISFYRIVGGGVDLRAYTDTGFVTANQEHEIFFVRNGGYYFNCYCRGGSHSTWDDAFTDVSHPTTKISQVMNLQFVSNSSFEGLLQFPFGYGLHPNDVPYLAD